MIHWDNMMVGQKSIAIHGKDVNAVQKELVLKATYYGHGSRTIITLD